MTEFAKPYQADQAAPGRPVRARLARPR